MIKNLLLFYEIIIDLAAYTITCLYITKTRFFYPPNRIIIVENLRLIEADTPVKGCVEARAGVAA